jgi:HTH-type transcriptional regulator/antitoxin HigA
MNTKPIKNEKEYKNTLKEIERLFDSEPGTPEGNHLKILVAHVEAYEDAYYSVPPAKWWRQIVYFLYSHGVIN